MNSDNQTLFVTTLAYSNNETSTYTNDTSGQSGVKYADSPEDVKQAILIFRLVLLGLGVIGSAILIFVYIKCKSIVTSRLAVYVINLTIAVIIDMLDIIVWSLKQFGYDYAAIEDLPKEVMQLGGLPSIGLPTTSLFLFLMITDRFFATCFARCYKSCYGSYANAVVLSVLFWLASFFLTFIIIYPDLLFAHQELHVALRFLISYIGPFVIKLLLAIVLVVKRKMVPDADESQAFIERHRKALYYTLTIVIVHLIFSLPYYVYQMNIYYPVVQYTIDEWVVLLAYAVSEVPLILNPVLCLSIHPEFRDSLVSVCTCSGRSHRDTGEGGDDHAECQPLAPLATSPIAEEKEHLDEAES